MKKKLLSFLVVFGIAGMIGCASSNQTTVPTMAPQETFTPTPEITVTEIPMATATSTPTAEPTATNTPIPEPTAPSTPTPTVAPTPTATPTPTNTPTPTPIPHEHVWKELETPATCTTDGRTWDECECGDVQNVILVPAHGHLEYTYQVVVEPSVENDGLYENICNVCGAVVHSGILEKLTPTPTPTPTSTPTPTPAPTNTPTPTPTPTSTPTPTPSPSPTPKYTYKDFEKTMYAKSSVNVRDLPSTEGKKIGSLNAWEKVTVTGQCKETNWYRILFNNVQGFVSGNYLVDNKPTPTPTPLLGEIIFKYAREAEYIENNATITLTGAVPVLYALFLEGSVKNAELEYFIDGEELLLVELIQDGSNTSFKVRVQPKGTNGKARIVFTMYGINESGDRVVLDEYILNIKVDISEDVTPRFTEDGLDYEGRETLFPGNAVTINTVNSATYELAVVNIAHADEAPYYRTKDNKKIRTTAKSDNESVVKASIFIANNAHPEIILAPVGTGTATITVTLHIGELNELIPSKVIDTYTFTVTVEEYKSSLEFREGDYIPSEHGYPYLVGEWPYGDNITAQVWSNSRQPRDSKAVLVFTGTGAMWYPTTASDKLGDAGPWNRESYCRFYNTIETAVIQEGITRTEDIAGTYLTSISLPSTLKEIGEFSFDSTKISELVLPDGLERIEEFALSWRVWGSVTNQLKQLVIPNSVTYIDGWAFYGRDGLQIILEEGTNTKGFDPDWDYGLDIKPVYE